MISCFADLPGGCGINRRSLQFESVYTAPHGMVKSCDENGAFPLKRQAATRRVFTDKERINNGVRMFMEDMLSFWAANGLRTLCCPARVPTGFMNPFFSGSCDFSQEIRSSYVNENVLTNADEFRLWIRAVSKENSYQFKTAETFCIDAKAHRHWAVCYHLLNTIKGAGYVAFGNLA